MRRARGTAAAAVLLLAAAGASAACRAPAVEAGALASASRWQERAAGGGTLVDERGTLRGVAALATLDCAEGRLRAEATTRRGSRDYRGHSNTGQPLASSSRVTDSSVGLSAEWPAAAPLALSAGLRWRQVRRRIADAGPVLGYPERFDWPALQLGLRWQQPLGATARLALHAELGAGSGGRLALRLPGADPARLRLGNSLGARSSAALDGDAGGGWRWRVALHAEAERLAAGPAATITRQGQPVAAAAQPRTTLRTATLALALQRSLR